MVKKIAVIAGGAGRIGFEICRTFCESGMSLVILGSSIARAIDTTRRLEKYGGQCLAIGCNVVNSEDVREAMEQSADLFGGIDVVVLMQGGHRSRGWSATRHLWAKKNDLIDKTPSPFEINVMKQGYEVEVLAK
jgi:NAD(P)-dependent dehydrogenase (short-subunit alcohol dehydrogenase family)